MVRLRNSSPFYLAEGIDFGDYDMRIRIGRAATRVVPGHHLGRVASAELVQGAHEGEIYGASAKALVIEE
jgi:hypothetical protein